MRFLTRFAFAALFVAAPLTFIGCDSNEDGGESGDEVTANGTVTNTFDRPVQGATLTFSSSASRSSDAADDFTVTTGADGSFSLDLPEGVYSVTITVPGYEPQTFSATVDGEGNVTIEVPEISGTGNIDINLYNALTGLIAGGTVECQRQLPNGSYSGVELVATTDMEGNLVVEGAFTGEA